MNKLSDLILSSVCSSVRSPSRHRLAYFAWRKIMQAAVHSILSYNKDDWKPCERSSRSMTFWPWHLPWPLPFSVKPNIFLLGQWCSEDLFLHVVVRVSAGLQHVIAFTFLCFIFRFLKNVSILLFMNKIDILAEKIQNGRSIKAFADKYPDLFPDYDKFTPSSKFS